MLLEKSTVEDQMVDSKTKISIVDENFDKSSVSMLAHVVSFEPPKDVNIEKETSKTSKDSIKPKKTLERKLSNLERRLKEELEEAKNKVPIQSNIETTNSEKISISSNVISYNLAKDENTKIETPKTADRNPAETIEVKKPEVEDTKNIETKKSEET